MTNRFQDLVDRWGTAVPSERANFQLYLTELCDALDVERPRPAGTGYEFEFPVKVVSGGGRSPPISSTSIRLGTSFSRRRTKSGTIRMGRFSARPLDKHV